MKTCNKCKEEKSFESFSKKSSSPSGLNCRCKECDKMAAKQWRADNPEKAKAATQRWNSENRDHVLNRQKNYYSENSEQIMAQMKEFLKSNPAHGLCKLAKTRAKKQGIPFEITPKDIIVPEFCPVLGLKLEFGEMQDRETSPSLDKICPELGYIPGNIAVMSYRANRIKNNGTAEDHRKIADWMDGFK